MKTRIIAILLSLAVLSSCWQEEVRVSGITLNTTSVTIELGQTSQLTATISPANADNKIVIWSTSDSAVAAVDAEGVVTALSPGQAEITAKSDDNSRYTDVCKVTVPEIFVPVESLTIEENEITIQKGATATVVATIAPENASDKQLRWISLDEVVATVSPEGVVTGVQPGKTRVIASTVDGGLSAYCTIIVEQKGESLALDPAELELYEFEHLPLKLVFTPEDTSYGSVVWSSDHEDIAIVDYRGEVYAVQAGTATVTATTADGSMSASCKVTVKCHVRKVVLQTESIILKPGSAPYPLVATVVPERASDKSLTWASSDTSVAAVSQEGVVTAIATGKAEITATSTDGNLSAKCVVIVAGGMVINPSSLALVVGNSVDLTVSLTSSDEPAPAVTWDSSDEKLATVDGNGHVVGIAAGNVTVSARTQSGLSAYCAIKVRNKIESITVLPSDPVKLYVGETQQFSLKLAPSDATAESVEWSLSNTEAASITSGGLLTAKARCDEGLEVIASDGIVTGKHAVQVMQQVTGISLTDANGAAIENLVLWEGETVPFIINMTPENANDRTSYSSGFEPLFSSFVTIKDNTITAGTDGYTREAVCSISPTGAPEANRPVAKCRITVHAHVSSLDITNVPASGSVTLAIGEYFTPKVSITPNGAYIKEWDVTIPEGTDVLSLSGSTLKAEKVGECTVTVISRDPLKIQKSFTVSVKPKDVTSLTLDKSSLELLNGTTDNITYTIEPSDVANKNVTCTVEPDIADCVVKENNVIEVTAKAEGDATITVTSVATPGKSATCALKVNHNTIHVTGVSIYYGSEQVKDLTLMVGDYKMLKAKVEPDNADNKDYHWFSSNTSVATISDNGQVRAISPGTTTLTVKTDDGGKEATCALTVKAEEVAVTSITISGDTHVLDYGGQVQLTATVLPTNATDKSVKWASDNTDIATVDANGLVTVNSIAGTVNITATSVAYPNVSGSYAIEVKKVTHVESVSISMYGSSAVIRNLNLYVNKSKRLAATVLPSTADNKAVKWYPAQGGVVVVAQDGTVTGVKPGETTVFAEALDNGTMTSCVVTVKANRVASILIYLPNDAPSLRIRKGETYDLVANLRGEDRDEEVSYPGVEWSSANDSIAKVDKATGHIEATGVGEVDITVRATEMIPDNFGREYQSTVTAVCHVIVMPSGSSNGGNEGVEFDDWNF